MIYISSKVIIPFDLYLRIQKLSKMLIAYKQSV